MRYRSLIIAVLTLLLLVLVPPLQASADPCGHSTSGAPAPETTSYFDGNQRFGPESMPSGKTVGSLLAGYQRFGNENLTPEAFDAKYFHDSNNPGDWNWPPNDGFSGPITKQELKAGTKVDRFGYEGGKFLAPAGTSFAQRALPPSNLNTPAVEPAANYHLYCVVKSFYVDGGGIAPAFGQPGGGTQYVLRAAYLPGEPADYSVMWLLNNHYLAEVHA